MKIVIDISDEKKAKYLVKLLEDIPYVRNIKVEHEKKKKKPNFELVFGIWKERDITLEDIRKKAWRKVSR